MDQIYNFLNELIYWVIWFYNTYKIIFIIVICVFTIFFLVKFFAALSFDIENFKKGVVAVGKAILFVIKLPYLILKKIWQFIKWILNARNRWLYRKSLKESIFNVIPQKIKIPFIYYLFSYKIRKQKKFRLRCIEKCIETEEKINDEFQFIIMIEASIGGGKTSFLNGFSHMKTLSLMQMIKDDLYSIEKKIFNVNYYDLRAIIENCYNLGFSESEIKAKILVNENFAKSFDASFDDHVSDIPKISLLESYIKAYVALLRNNYVMCNYKLYSRITKRYNYTLEPNAFDIKEEATRKKFFLPPYLIIVDDEKALSDFKNTETPKDLDKKGTDIIMRLFRQLQRETTYYISSTQNTSRIALIIRELANTYVQIQSLSIIGDQNHLANIYRKKEAKIFNKMLKFARKHFKDDKKQEEFLLSNNEFKSKIFAIYDKQRELFSAGFLSYHVKIASKLDLLKEKDCRELKLVFPLTWCFGVYNTCEYSEFNDFLMTLSNIKSDHELKEISSLFEKNEDRFKKLIERKEKKEKVSTEKKGEEA